MSDRSATLGGMLVFGLLVAAVGAGVLVTSLRDLGAGLGVALLLPGFGLVVLALLGHWWDVHHPRGDT